MPMQKPYSHGSIALLAAALVIACPPVRAAQSAFTPPNWTLTSAQEASARADTVAELRPLFTLARAGQDEELLRALQALATDERLPLPARERLLQEFAGGLADLPARRLAPALAAWLLAWRPQILVPHGESPAVGAPLFNVAAATAGSLSAWSRQLARADSERLLGQDANGWPDAWLAAWLAASGDRRTGLADALDGAPLARLEALADATLARLPLSPELSGITLRIALALSDPQLFGAGVASGGSDGLAAALRAAREHYDDDELAAILQRAVREAPAPNAALVIAELGPVVADRPGIERLLFDLLAHPELGGAASLLLANSNDPLVRQRLDELAAREDGLAARRAGLARALRPDPSRSPGNPEMRP